MEVEARGEDDAARDIHNALREIERDVDRASKDIDASFKSATDAAEKHFKDLTDSINTEVNVQHAGWIKAGNAISDNIGSGARRASEAIDELGDATERNFRKIDKESSLIGQTLSGVGRTVLNVFESIGTSSQSASKALAGLGVAGGPAGLTAILVSIIALSSALVPIVFGLAGAFIDLAGAIALVPAAGATLAAVMGTLAFTFNGVGEAVDALAKGKAKDIKEAFDKISPSAREFAREINALRKPLSDLRKTVQEAFFAQFNDQLTLLARSLLPTFRTGMEGVASALANLAVKLIDVARSADSVRVFGAVFESAERIIRRLTPIATELFRVILQAVEAGLPFVEQFFDLIGAGLGKFSKFLDEAIRTGEFEQVLKDALATIKDLGALAKSVGRLIVALFGDAGDEGRTFIQSLTLAIDKMAEFFESAEGQQNIQDLLDSLITIGQALVVISGFLVSNAQAWRSFKDTISEVGESIKSTISDVFNSIGSTFDALTPKVQSASDKISSFFSSIGQGLTTGFNAVATFGGQIIAFFTTLPDRIISAISALPSKFVEFFLLVFDTVNFLIGFAIGTIISQFTQMPDRILLAITRILVIVGTVFNQMRAIAIERVISLVLTVAQFFDQLPIRITTTLIRVVNAVITGFNNARAAAGPIVSSIVHNVVSIFNRLPGLVGQIIGRMRDRVISDLRSIAQGAFNIGLEIIRGVGRGIEAGVGAVVALAQRAARRILDGMNRALDINSPSRVAAREIGIPFVQGIGVGIEQGASDPIKAVHTLARDMIPGVPNATASTTTDNQSIVFSPGAIQISLAGNVSQADAQIIGRTVGQNIIDTLARNHAQLRIRTI